MIETGGVFFDAKGLVHPPNKIVASPHYLPDPRGNRSRNGVRYVKILFSERQRLLEKKFPSYINFDRVFGQRLCELPVSNIDHLYRPVDRLRELRQKASLDDVEEQALSFVETLKESSNVPWRNLGISGSILVKLHLPTSDIDPVVYGSTNCRNVYVALKSQIGNEKGPIKPYDVVELKRLHKFRYRDTTMSFEDFIRTKSGKVLQGKFMGRGYTIKMVKNWNEVGEKYGSVRYSPVGHAKVAAKVADSSEAIFTPCRYLIKSVRILDGPDVDPPREIASFRMRFCDQAVRGENIVASGKVERVRRENGEESYRLVVGGRPSDFILRTKKAL